jgi:hypothetical protein
MDRFGCATLSQLQDRVLHEPATVPALLDLPDRAGQRDVPRPELLPRAARDVVPLLRTYPSLKIWVAGCSTGEEVYSLAILLHEEGLLARTLIYATDINPQALQKAEAGVYDGRPDPGFTATTASGGRGSLSDYYTAAYGRAVFDKSLKKHIVFSDHSLATDSVFAEVQLVSCRNVLIYFNRDSCRIARSACSASAVPEGLPRHRRQGVAALLGARRRLHDRSRRSHLPEAGSGMTLATSPRWQDGRRHRRSARRPAASRRCRCCCRPCRRLLPAGVRRPASAARAPEPAGRDLRAKCALPVREAEDKSRSSGHGVLRAADYHLLVDAGPRWRCRSTSRSLLAPVDRRAVRIGRRLYGARLLASS